MARAHRATIDDVQAHRLDVARDFATTHRVHVVLKGHRTIVASPDGRDCINLTGNPGMATGRHRRRADRRDRRLVRRSCSTPKPPRRLAVYLHGLAGDLAEADEGEVALIAGDIVDSPRRRGARADAPRRKTAAARQS